ncbi:peroxide stress protein YaaA [Pseudaestuariivita sp.]|uniref:peroxide stress protein YaaA n=1 Tax=Pseudaestuariivita sp. TaxID=2211669 RepID=UPI0040596D92
MLVTISPAKRLDWQDRGVEMSAPEFQDDAVRLARTARNLTLRDLKKLMSLSDDLARLNRDRFKAFAEAPEAAHVRPAAFAFAGDTYQGLDAASLSGGDLDWAQERLAILSGLYGVLRPRDAIQPYRLEMGSRLKTRRGSSLYDYWGKTPAKALNTRAEEVGAEVLVNCASQEYFGAVDLKALKLEVVTPQFLELKDGSAKTISFYAKRARGAMARYIVQNRLTDVDAISGFDLDGYAFDAALSAPGKPAFVREAVASSPAQAAGA